MGRKRAHMSRATQAELFSADEFQGVDDVMLDVIVGQSTDPGRLRANNEDAMGSFIPKSPQEARSHGWMFVVADGVGGRDFGDVASDQTAGILERGFALAATGTSLASLLRQLIQEANDAVHDVGLQRERRGKQMASTVVACALRYDKAIVAHVGDSRCYHVRDGKILFVSQDHTFVNEQRQLGLITPAEAAISELRNVLTRSLGPERFVTVDTVTLSLKPGDTLLLCTDGLHGGIYDQDILRVVTETSDPQKAAEELVRYAIEVDGSDNATAQVIQVRAVESVSKYRMRPFRIPGV
jgi:serine/threonine protein phosphatase PrpC